MTGPIHKARMYEIGFEFPGQTEFFAARCGVEEFRDDAHRRRAHSRPRDDAHPAARSRAPAAHGGDRARGRVAPEHLLVRRGGGADRGGRFESPRRRIRRARSRRDRDHRARASRELNRTATDFPGPFSPDTIFHRAVAGEFAAVLCMYHDQGLIPLKLHAFHEGVNVTLGLPFPRTSPDHGTAFEIAGKGIARPDSMIAAIRLAVELAAQ